MMRKSSPVWRFGIAGFALLAALAVYWLARSAPPALIEPLQLGLVVPADLEWVLGSAPSLFYTLSIALLLGICAATAASARRHCLVWIGIALCLEVSQADPIAQPLAAWLASTLPDAAWGLFAPYWTRGVFDPLDLLATLLGGALAIALLSHNRHSKI